LSPSLKTGTPSPKQVSGGRLQLFETLASQLSDAVIVTDANHADGGPRILWVNEAFARLTGYEREEVVGQTPRLLQGPRTSGKILARIRRALATREPVEAELVNYRKDGTPFWSDIRISPVFGADGTCTHFVALERDATQRKAREELDRLRMVALERIAVGAPLQEVFEQIVATVESQSPGLVATVALLEKGRLRRVPLGSAATCEFIDSLGLLDVDILTDPARERLAGGRPVLCPWLETDASCSDACPTLGMRERWRPSAFYPIRAQRGDLLGVLTVYARDCRPVSEVVWQVLSEGSSLARIALERDAQLRRMERLALYDPLTDLPNRTMFFDLLEHEMAVANRRGSRLALALLDLDRFKTINDAFGHEAGDRLLREAAARLRQALRAGDTIARMGGDEFLLLLPDVASGADAERIARRIVDALEPSFVWEGTEVQVRASAGLALYPDHARDASELIRRADIAMYAAKETRSRESIQAAWLSPQTLP
jgi:diguanylate cyclase (GGDEF)-like protein/PAS domain S-box-containing protein